MSCTMSVTGATVTSLWLYNIVDLRKTVIGAIDYVYNGPSECWNENICEKSIPNFLFLYIAAVCTFLHCHVFLCKNVPYLLYCSRACFSNYSPWPPKRTMIP